MIYDLYYLLLLLFNIIDIIYYYLLIYQMYVVMGTMGTNESIPRPHSICKFVHRNF